MNIDLLSKSVQHVKQIIGTETPSISIVLGSGWSKAVGSLNEILTIPYSEIPALGETSVKGHSGLLKLASLDETSVLIFQGRRHFYEGAGWESVIFPAFLSSELGLNSILLTNAAGGINPDFTPGDIMIIEDHINMMGSSPLIGSNPALSKTRFPDQTHVYDPGIRKLLKEAATEAKMTSQHGVYLATSGPSYETPAEIKAFSSMGADAIGMSTVPEAMIANALGLKTGALSCITNMASGVSKSPLSHEEVIETASKALPGITSLLFRTQEKRDR
jgi:purine-nucleoside phosphorylase